MTGEGREKRRERRGGRDNEVRERDELTLSAVGSCRY